MINNLIKLAEHLDRMGYHKEADYVDFIISEAAKKKKKKKTKKKKSSGKRTPTKPALWEKAKAEAKKRFDVYPSAYANGWAAKWYKGKGGGWRGKKPVK